LVTIRRYDEFASQLVRAQKQRRKSDSDSTTVGVYDILPANCMRKSHYQKTSQDGENPIAEPQMPYLRGSAIESAIARLVATTDDAFERHKRHERGGIVCYTDITQSQRIIEIKDTSAGRRLVPADIQFKGYLMQVLYYLVIAEKEEAMLVINYSSRETIWHHNDSDGKSWFYRPANAKPAGVECWHISISKDDYARELLWDQMQRRKNAFLKARQSNDVSFLPRIRVRDRKMKCSGCPFYERCMRQDGETEEARAMANDLELLDVRGFISS
jgi:CRISPR/Cas system-associated exonuclease Cas4 (RecB family)